MHLFSSSFAVSPPFFLPAAVADRSSNDRRLTSSSSSSCCCLGLGNKLFEPVKERGGGGRVHTPFRNFKIMVGDKPPFIY